MSEGKFPSWRYGPDGAAEIFASAEEVPSGWAEHPSAFADPMDRDGDGKMGGSLPKRGRPPKQPLDL